MEEFENKMTRSRVLKAVLKESERFIKCGIFKRSPFSTQVSFDKDDIDRIRVVFKTESKETFYTFDISRLYNIKDKDADYFIEDFIPCEINKTLKEILTKGVDYI